MTVFNKQDRNCKHCSRAFTYRPAGKDKGRTHLRGLFCSWECKSKNIKDSKPLPFSPVHFGECLTCGTVYTSRMSRKYCSKGCGNKANAEIMALLKLPNVFAKCCVGCGNRYSVSTTSVGGMPTRYCSDVCRNAAASETKRVHKASRKARLKHATVERVDPFRVFDRDEWRCVLCGIPTPKAKRGTHDDDAPELDHVVPLSKGGQHSYKNTQCACRKCNAEKSDTLLFA